MKMNRRMARQVAAEAAAEQTYYLLCLITHTHAECMHIKSKWAQKHKTVAIKILKMQ